MNINVLQKAINNSKLTKLDVARESKITRSTLDNILAGLDTKISTIERLCAVLDIPVSSLFDSGTVTANAWGNGSGASINGNVSIGNDQERIIYLEKLLEEKERTIQILLNK